MFYSNRRKKINSSFSRVKSRRSITKEHQKLAETKGNKLLPGYSAPRCDDNRGITMCQALPGATENWFTRRQSFPLRLIADSHYSIFKVLPNVFHESFCLNLKTNLRKIKLKLNAFVKF